MFFAKGCDGKRKLPRRSGPRVFDFLLITTIQNDLVNSTYILVSTLVSPLLYFGFARNVRTATSMGWCEL
jgi:hypothetical protein